MPFHFRKNEPIQWFVREKTITRFLEIKPKSSKCVLDSSWLIWVWSGTISKYVPRKLITSPHQIEMTYIKCWIRLDMMMMMMMMNICDCSQRFLLLLNLFSKQGEYFQSSRILFKHWKSSQEQLWGMYSNLLVMELVYTFSNRSHFHQTKFSLNVPQLWNFTV